MKAADARGGRRGIHSQSLMLITGCFGRVAVRSSGDGGLKTHRTASIINHLPKIFKSIGQWSLSINELCLISSNSLQIVYDMRQMATGVSGQKKKHI